MYELIGRQEESDIFLSLLKTDSAEMLAVVGRRRVGKTFLIQTVYKNDICFNLTGSQKSPLKEQLQNFAYQMETWSKSKVAVAPPKSWSEAFKQLSKFIDSKKFRQKKVIFLDELPWLASHKSGFLAALGYFWNNWASQKNIIVVICGSAASWMIDKVINNKGGLHNRVTKLVVLQPFTLSETKQYLQSRKIS
ncbi:MAG: ATP-binding protein, partial [Bacteroidota bacterium]|nr:ATP-binding protein [Bacteroidota bacterium]